MELPADVVLSAVLGYAVRQVPALAEARRLEKRIRVIEERVLWLETPMNITQVPASTRQWGLSSLVPGVPGRLGIKVDKIVIHWMDGTLASTDKVFTGQTARKTGSAHFGVEDGEVHQYVALGNVAWHAGNWLANLSSIGIEHSAQPGRDATEETYRTSASLICQVCRQLGLEPSRGLLRKHSEFSPTQCCGTVDLDRIAAYASEEWNRRDVQLNETGNAAPAAVASVRVPVDFVVRSTAGVKWRERPSLSAPVKALYPKDTDITCSDTVQGDPVNGETRWYKSKRSGWYSTAAYNKQI